MPERLTPERLAEIIDFHDHCGAGCYVAELKGHIDAQQAEIEASEADAERLSEQLTATTSDYCAQQAEIARLIALVYVPGRWSCAKCAYVVSKAVLSMADGEAYASQEDGGPCPNDGTPLEHVAWREDAKSLSRWGDNLMDECDRLRALLGEAREALAPFAVGAGEHFHDEPLCHECKARAVLAKLAQETDRG